MYDEMEKMWKGEVIAYVMVSSPDTPLEVLRETTKTPIQGLRFKSGTTRI
jgi:hypothetical protein